MTYASDMHAHVDFDIAIWDIFAQMEKQIGPKIDGWLSVIPLLVWQQRIVTEKI
jgi:hypothetical protein